ncbi:MutS protein-like protein [Zancudomyces culisetae]|uniref:MutS protein-like protein n=1 Tax=Zancudomyces culisetae TaxID=1213189 RepID=A0A1R1PEN8_ZANCU|nr:MutS protein-like protein [Zancudomyces culisetae]|eukprot:OMH79465.1 MutS protein-like protein [Zancudomyces culisetae]
MGDRINTLEKEKSTVTFLLSTEESRAVLSGSNKSGSIITNHSGKVNNAQSLGAYVDGSFNNFYSDECPSIDENSIDIAVDEYDIATTTLEKVSSNFEKERPEHKKCVKALSFLTKELENSYIQKRRKTNNYTTTETKTQTIQFSQEVNVNAVDNGRRAKIKTKNSKNQKIKCYDGEAVKYFSNIIGDTKMSNVDTYNRVNEKNSNMQTGASNTDSPTTNNSVFDIDGFISKRKKEKKSIAGKDISVGNTNFTNITNLSNVGSMDYNVHKSYSRLGTVGGSQSDDHTAKKYAHSIYIPEEPRGDEKSDLNVYNVSDVGSVSASINNHTFTSNQRYDVYDASAGKINAKKTTPVSTGRVGSVCESAVQNENVLVALIEGSGIASEIGVCALNTETMECFLTQYADMGGFSKTIDTLKRLGAQLVVMASTVVEKQSKLFWRIGSQLKSSIVVQKVPRSFFNEERGLGAINKWILEADIPDLMLKLQSKYYCLAAIGALFTYIEKTDNKGVLQQGYGSGNFIRGVFQFQDSTMYIDPATQLELRLVEGVDKQESAFSLFGIMKHTRTAMGTRLLRASILQPSTNITTINERLDAVEELLAWENVFFGIQSGLKQIPDIDGILSQVDIK